MVEFLKSSLHKNVGYFFIGVSLFFILISVVNLGVGCLLTFFILPFYFILFVGILSLILRNKEIIAGLQVFIMYFVATVSLLSEFYNGYTIILYLVTLLLLLGYGFYTINFKVKIILSIIILGITFYVCSPKETIGLRLFSVVNIFAFLFASFYIAYIIFVNSEVGIFSDFNDTKEQLEVLKKRIAYYKIKQPEYEKYIEELLLFSSEELKLIKEMRSSLYTQQEGKIYDTTAP